jgi:lysophospholipase L1-like esterase
LLLQIDGDEYQRNVWDILDHIAEYHPAAHVVCITPSTLHPEQWMTHMQQVAGPDPASAYTELDRSVQNNKRYAGLMKGIIREWNKSRADVRDGNLRGNGKKVAVIDAFRAHSIAKGQHGVTNEQLFTDGLHWTAKGYEVCLEFRYEIGDQHLLHPACWTVDRHKRDHTDVANVRGHNSESNRLWI